MEYVIYSIAAVNLFHATEAKKTDRGYNPRNTFHTRRPGRNNRRGGSPRIIWISSFGLPRRSDCRGGYRSHTLDYRDLGACLRDRVLRWERLGLDSGYDRKYPSNSIWHCVNCTRVGRKRFWAHHFHTDIVLPNSPTRQSLLWQGAFDGFFGDAARGDGLDADGLYGVEHYNGVDGNDLQELRG